MGRPRKLNKPRMTSVPMYEKLVDELKKHKPRSCTWPEFFDRSFAKLRQLEEKLEEFHWIDDTGQSEVTGKYVNLIKELASAGLNEKQSEILDSIISSDGTIEIAKYSVTEHK